MKHCNTLIEIKKGKQNGKELFYAECSVCGMKQKAETEKELAELFGVRDEQKITDIVTIPKKPSEVIQWGNNNISTLIKQSAQFIDKPATQRMIETNLRYISKLSGKKWDKIWNSEEGRESIKYAMSEANYYACTLGELGDVVPFGEFAEFIPAVECFTNALTVGRNAPFLDILITPINADDNYDNYQKSGNFIFEIKRNYPGGDCIGVAIEATRSDNNKIIGTILYEPFLMQIAKDHSPSYKAYVIEKEDFKRMQIEGKLKKDETGREYFTKTVEYKDKDGKDKSFQKKIYEYDLVNPYVTSDKVKMLCKVAGKFFFRPYMKTRNASAMAEEWQDEEPENREQAADMCLNKAASQFSEQNIKDAEIVVEKEDKKLFDEEENI